MNSLIIAAAFAFRERGVMRICMLIVGACVAVLFQGMAAVAGAEEKSSRQSGADGPVARLVALGDQQVAIDWRGQNSVMDSKRFCISSSTGSYRLTLRVENYLAPPNSGALGYTIRFKSPDGREHNIAVSSGEVREVTGTVNPAFECRGMANAWMEIILNESAALAAVSGDYSSGLSLEMSAL